jgi:thioredoxin reductase (NADPH)
VGTQEVVSIRREDPFRVVTLSDGSEVSCKALILATGVAVRVLDVPGVARFLGAGVYYGAAMTEAAAYRDRDVVIVGGGNSAGQGALFFSRYARQVMVVIRAGALSQAMSQYLVDRIEVAENVEVVTRVELAEVKGDKSVECVVLNELDSARQRTAPASGIFIFIGAAPRTEMLRGLVRLDDKGFVMTGPDLADTGARPAGWPVDRDPYLFETSVPGVFAVGDVRAGSGKRVAAAVGEGSATVSMVHRYLETV